MNLQLPVHTLLLWFTVHVSGVPAPCRISGTANETNLHDLLRRANSTPTLQCIANSAMLDLSANGLTIAASGSLVCSDDEFPELVELNLSDNGFVVLEEGWIANCTRLERLLLADNKFTSPPPLYPLGTSLKKLSLAKNVIGSLPNDFLRDFVALTELDLSRNPIDVASTQTLLRNVGGLRTLDLSGNNLTTFPNFSALTTVEQWPLRSLNLSGNQITTIERLRVTSFADNLTFDISGNPLFCDCETLRSLFHFHSLIGESGVIAGICPYPEIRQRFSWQEVRSYVDASCDQAKYGATSSSTNKMWIYVACAAAVAVLLVVAIVAVERLRVAGKCAFGFCHFNETPEKSAKPALLSADGNEGLRENHIAMEMFVEKSEKANRDSICDGGSGEITKIENEECEFVEKF